MEEYGALAVRCVGVEQACQNTRESEFVGAQIVERIEAVCEYPIQLALDVAGGGEARPEGTEHTADALHVGLPDVAEFVGKGTERRRGSAYSPLQCNLI